MVPLVWWVSRALGRRAWARLRRLWQSRSSGRCPSCTVWFRHSQGCCRSLVSSCGVLVLLWQPRTAKRGGAEVLQSRTLLVTSVYRRRGWQIQSRCGERVIPHIHQHVAYQTFCHNRLSRISCTKCGLLPYCSLTNCWGRNKAVNT